MDFNKLENSIKEELYSEITQFANSIGGSNAFLTMIEEIRAAKPNPLLNKSGTFHTTKVKISISKSMFKDTFSTLFDAIRREERSGDMLNGIAPKEYKVTMNMMRTLGNVNLFVEPKKEGLGEGFEFTILDITEDKKTKITFIFKVIFFYHLDEAKKALAFKK